MTRRLCIELVESINFISLKNLNIYLKIVVTLVIVLRQYNNLKILCKSGLVSGEAARGFSFITLTDAR